MKCAECSRDSHCGTNKYCLNNKCQLKRATSKPTSRTSKKPSGHDHQSSNNNNHEEIIDDIKKILNPKNNPQFQLSKDLLASLLKHLQQGKRTSDKGKCQSDAQCQCRSKSTDSSKLCSKYCIHGTCSECLTDVDCPEPYHFCDHRSHMCSKYQCIRDDQCPNGYYCDYKDHKCVPVPK